MERWFFSKVVEISNLQSFSGRTEKYRPALSKSNSACDSLSCVRLVIVSLIVSVGR